jgi:5-methylcytosine-specific restriction endonuclease McrA
MTTNDIFMIACEECNRLRFVMLPIQQAYTLRYPTLRYATYNRPIHLGTT